MREEDKRALIKKARESWPAVIDSFNDPVLRIILSLKLIDALRAIELIPTDKQKR